MTFMAVLMQTHPTEEVGPGVCQMRMVTLPSFLVGREVRSHQEVQGSPATGGRESRLRTLRHFHNT